ncbi:hypothetical protein PYW07_014348 [Mythimna separata]|uniref:Fanconi anemia group D2 protein n=1 Tax=Mythimna separata TaxID=271217 RepID=A0AAD7Z144_MYTSE|nr:hypothetical protein PYW07_014348 [Mythimna separata]
MSDNAYLEAVQGLRNALGWTTSVAQAQEVATSQVLTATAIRNSMVSSKVIGNSWLKAISSCKVHTDHKPIDFIILLIAYSTSEEKQRQVENLIRKQIKLNILKEELLDDVFKKFKPILKEYLRHLIDLSNSLLKTKVDPAVESFASYMYSLMFAQLEECCPTIVAELLQLGLDSKQCVMGILLVLNNVAAKDMSLLKPQSVQMLTLLDRMDDMPLDEVRAVMNLLCGLAYSYENSVIRDDLHMIIRKELGSSNPRIKVQGILAAIHAVKYLMVATTEDDQTREIPDDVSYGSVTHLSEGDLREAAQIIELISRSTRQFPDMIAFFYDELSKVILSASFINKNFLSWLTDAVTNDLQQNFIVDTIEVDRVGEIKLAMQYCLNADSEMDEMIAVNIAGMTLESKSEVYIGILSPLFQLVQTLHFKQHEGNLSSIDALLGCPVVMPKFDIDLVEDMDTEAISNILDCLVHCINWFRELLNAFATQDDDDLKTKTLKRVLQVEELESFVQEILIKTKIPYKPPVCTFNVNKYTGEQFERKAVKIQTAKQKVTKKAAQDDTVLPETARSQATQNNVSVKSSLEISLNMPLRQLNLNLLHLIKTDMTEDKDSETELTVKTLSFLLKCVNRNIENVLISKIKRKTFLTKQETTVYDAAKAEHYAKTISEVLPQLVEHLKNLGTAIYEATKARLEKGMTNSEHLDLWKDVATIMKNMSEIAKTLENRNNLAAFFKKSIPVLKIFMSQGIPILEIQFKTENQEVLEILKILQQSTRFLQTLCCHSRLKKDTVLMSKVPHMRQLLETLIYKVKAVLAANNCSEAFWMGNLKNKDIHGEVIVSQQSIASEESAEDCDDQLPEDEDSDDTDDEMLNPDSRSLSDIV